MTSIAPGSASRIGNRHYKTDEEFLFACADAMREEYKAIVDAGLILQLDDPAIAENWDMVNPEPTVEDYRRFSMVRVEALNHAIRGLPEDRIRFHLCWGSWHGPHTTDIPMRDIVEVMLAVKCRRLLVRGRQRPPRARVEGVAGRRSCPTDKLILPGIVSHATNVVEHPELVAERIARFASVGRPGAGHRLHRLRPRRARPPADRLGQARSAGAGRGAGHAPALALGRIERPSRGARPCTQRTPNGRIVDHGQEQEGIRARHRGERASRPPRRTRRRAWPAARR